MSKTVYFMLLCFSILFISCSEDDRYQLSEPEKSEKGFKRGIVSFKEVKAKLSGTTGKAKDWISGNAFKFGEEGYILSIDSTNIIEYTNDTLTTYTFRVSTVEDENYTFSNLIVKVQNGETEEYVAHYLPTPEWMAAHSSGEYLPYEGEGKLVFSDGEPADGTQQGRMVMCSYSIEPVWECDAGNPHPPGTPGCDGGSHIIGYEIKSYCITVPGGGGGGSGDDPPNGDWDGESPINGPGIPTDPNYGGGITPCQSLETKIDEPDFRVKINNLKGNLSTTSEKGWTNYEQNGNQNQYEAMVPGLREDGKYYVRPLNQTSDVIGYMHAHTIRPDKDMPIPSVADFNGFVKLLDTRLSFNKSTDDCYVIMVGIHGDGHESAPIKRTYALKLENVDNLKDWLLEYDTEDKRNEYFKKMQEKEREIHKHANEEEKNEIAVLDLLGECYSDLGLGLYKANDSFTGWSRMIPGTYGGVDYTPCE